MPFLGSTLGGIGGEATNISQGMREAEDIRRAKFREQMEKSYLGLAQQQAQRQAVLGQRTGTPVTWTDEKGQRHSSVFSLGPDGKLVRQDLPGVVQPKLGSKLSLTDAQQQAAEFLGYSSPNEVPPEQKTEFDQLTLRGMGLQPVSMQSTSVIADPDSETGYSKVTKSTITGQEVQRTKGVPPPGGPDTQTTHQVYKKVLNADGTESLVPVTETSEKRRLGGKGAAAPTIPAGVHPSTIKPARPAGGGRGAGLAGKPLTDEDYAAAVKSLQGGLAWAQVTKGWKPASQLALMKYMQERNIPIPKQGAAGGQAKLVMAGLQDLHVALWGDPSVKGASGEGLTDTLKVLDNRKRVWTHLLPAWTFARTSINPTLWSRMTPELLNNILSRAGVGRLNDDEFAYVSQMNRAITAIQALRTVQGLPRSTQQLMDQYIKELPDPATTNSSDRAKYKLALVERSVRVAMRVLAPEAAEPIGGTGVGEQPLPD